MRPETLALIRDRKLAKGDVFEVARLAGIMAAKKTSDLIPLCHPLPITGVTVDFAPLGGDALRIEAAVKVVGKTGVEMEALTAASVAALTVYDMCKSADRGMTIEAVRLEEKAGGKSGHYVRAADTAPSARVGWVERPGARARAARPTAGGESPRWASQSLDPPYETAARAARVGWVERPGAQGREAHQAGSSPCGGPRKASTHPTKRNTGNSGFPTCSTRPW